MIGLLGLFHDTVDIREASLPLRILELALTPAVLLGVGNLLLNRRLSAVGDHVRDDVGIGIVEAEANRFHLLPF